MADKWVMNIDPKEIKGNWAYGWALDRHTISSVPLGEYPQGHKEYDTKRSEIGEAVYKLKYRHDMSQVSVIAQVAAEFIKSKPELSDICAVCATPPSDTRRRYQPVLEVARAVGSYCRIPVPADYIQKIKTTPVLKNEVDSTLRRKELQGAFRVADERFAGKHLLMFDDLYRSGDTLQAICTALITQGKVGKVSVLTATQTRTRR